MRLVTRLLSLLLACLLVGLQPACATPRTAQPVTAPKVIFFDVNETLLDLESMRQSVGAALGGRQELLPLWFSTMLHYSLVETVTGSYHDFGAVGTAALMMVAENNGIALSQEQARAAIVKPLLALPAHPDVREGLRALKEQGYTLVTLTNSSHRAVQTQLENAGLTGFFTRNLSIEDIQVYKPDLRAYRWAAEQMGVKPEDAVLVAAHGWDVAGAKAAGFQAIFVARPGQSLYPLAAAPDQVVKDIQALAEVLGKRP
ncbi:haloacid dehalogenase type II [Pyxidicoccus fallax]|uniref:Haloacid dehalogenase type II n=1 Tax=Pyxidicoccus fallax TaxID=394095 RepID=A0A848L661_9BACT|nr:haloacid dehalogenase type II [Pyxidicoccus fallax]NMO14219.1 haloacid dehalogenase type II [Pyxidicoccus fallax]NPC80389.1 haloacid dehalogenase type II [Pyxidicoccus fallax]